MKTPLVLSGPPRSGTTLLSSLFDGHSEINWLPDEGYFFEHLHLHRSNVKVFLDSAGLEPFIEGLRDRAIMPPTHKPLTDFPSLRFDWNETAFKTALPPKNGTIRELWDSLVDAYLAGLGQTPKRFVCIKAADYGRSVAGARRFFPDARCIIIVRDPVDSLNSLRRCRQNSACKLLTWPTMAQAISEMNALASMPEIDWWLRYEDLRADKETTMRALTDWLDLPYEETLTVPSMLEVEWTNNSSFAGEREDTLSESEKAYIRQATAPFCKRFGYPLAADHMPKGL